MKVAFLADVHSNLHALEAVMRRLDSEGADLVLCAGDVVGYGAFPNECCRIIERLASRCIRGNHDRSAITRDTSMMNAYAAAAANWTAQNLDSSSSAWLAGLEDSCRRTFDQRNLLMVHGSPRDPDEYIFEEDLDESIMRSAEAEILVMAHTHVPFVHTLSSGLVINPGSVGQPRDRDPRASFATLDVRKMRCKIHRVEYPVDEAAAAIREAGLPRALADRLFVGV